VKSHSFVTAAPSGGDTVGLRSVVNALGPEGVTLTQGEPKFPLAATVLYRGSLFSVVRITSGVSGSFFYWLMSADGNRILPVRDRDLPLSAIRRDPP
jgi:hypothetical protein